MKILLLLVLGILIIHSLVSLMTSLSDENTIQSSRVKILESKQINTVECKEELDWLVHFNQDGSIKEIKNSIDSDWYKGIDTCLMAKDGSIIISVSSATKDTAVKIATEKRADFLAKNEKDVIQLN